MKLSVVIPCLNESDTVAKCVTTALATMAKIDIEGEAIVAEQREQWVPNMVVAPSGNQRLHHPGFARPCHESAGFSSYFQGHLGMNLHPAEPLPYSDLRGLPEPPNSFSFQ